MMIDGRHLRIFSYKDDIDERSLSLKLMMRKTKDVMRVKEEKEINILCKSFILDTSHHSQSSLYILSYIGGFSFDDCCFYFFFM
jgi:hypothetical protein